MARGFESKDVEFQQEQARQSGKKGPRLTAEEQALETKRQNVELALSKVRAERSVATNPNHRQVLDNAIVALEAEMRALETTVNRRT